MLIWFGVRPVTRLLLPPPAETASAESFGAPRRRARRVSPAADDGFGDSPDADRKPRSRCDEFFAALAERRDKGPQRSLQKLVDFDEEHAAAILRAMDT